MIVINKTLKYHITWFSQVEPTTVTQMKTYDSNKPLSLENRNTVRSCEKFRYTKSLFNFHHFLGRMIKITHSNFIKIQP
jgi:hypothetical protein